MKTSYRVAVLAGCVVALCALGVGVGGAAQQAPTRYAVVHETDVHGEGSVSVITYQEYVAKRREAFKLGIAFKRALMAARREWSRSESQRTRSSGRHGRGAIGGIHSYSGRNMGRYSDLNRRDRHRKPRRKAFPSLDVSPPSIRCVKVFAASEDAQKCADGYERMLAQKGSGLSKAQKLNPELPDEENTKRRQQRDWHNRHRRYSPLRDDLRKPELTKEDMDKAMELFEQEFQRLSEGGVRRGLARPGANGGAGIKRIGGGLGGEPNPEAH